MRRRLVLPLKKVFFRRRSGARERAPYHLGVRNGRAFRPHPKGRPYAPARRRRDGACLAMTGAMRVPVPRRLPRRYMRGFCGSAGAALCGFRAGVPLGLGPGLPITFFGCCPRARGALQCPGRSKIGLRRSVPFGSARLHSVSGGPASGVGRVGVASSVLLVGRKVRKWAC